jgi:hypothetical protein
MEYNVTGEVRFDFDFDIEAENEEQAREIAKERLEDYYRLDSHGAYHDPRDVEVQIYDVYAPEDEDDDE